MHGKFYSNTWAVHFHPPHRDIAERVSKKHGFEVLGQIGNLEGHYHIRHKDVRESAKEKAKEKTDLLSLEEEVKWAEQQEILHRFKRDAMPTDPEFKEMWYLLNTGQATGPAGVDINIAPVWKKNITGNGVIIAVCDDGVDFTHPDLAPNYDKEASIDLNDNDDDPRPRDSDPDNCHGTRCAGEVAAAANNGICGVGVAYNAKIGGVRMLDGQATDALEARALGFKSDYVDIYINCWGPKDDGKTFGKPGPIAARALKEGALNGRNGLGSVFIWATGNGGLTDDDCNCDGYTTSIYTISIGCIGDHGLSAYYTEKDIPRGNSLYINIPTCACKGVSNAEITKLEHVVLTVSFVHKKRGDVSIDLFSPSKTRSQMLSTRKYDDSDEGLDEWNFMTVHKWGENPRGIWQMKITDNNNQEQNDLFSREVEDVEDLEEQVIDEKTKSNKEKWKKMRQEDPHFDAPYPAGVRRNKVVHQQGMVYDDGVSTPVFRSPVPTETYRSNIAKPEDSSEEQPVRFFAGSINGDDFNPESKRDDITKPFDLDSIEKQLFKNVNLQGSVKKHELKKRGSLFNFDNQFKKVQVTEEETGMEGRSSHELFHGRAKGLLLAGLNVGKQNSATKSLREFCELFQSKTTPMSKAWNAQKNFPVVPHAIISFDSAM
eukprot:gene325-957_t